MTTRDHVFNFVREFITKNGWAPTMREICVGVGVVSTSTVHSHVRKLERDGYITRVPGSPRAMRLVGPNYDRAGSARLTPAEVEQVRARWIPGVRCGPGRRRSNAAELAAEFGRSEARIRQICCGAGEGDCDV